MSTFLVKCDSCVKVKVCTLVKAIAPLMENWADEEKPFKVEQLATICKEYLNSEELPL